MFWLAASMITSSLVSGYSQYTAGKEKEDLLQQEGYLSQVDANKQALIALDDGYRRRQRQAMDYIGAGVEIQGTPLLMLAETAKRTETQAEEIRTTGRNQRALYNKNAKVAYSEGRAGLVNQLLGAAGTIAEY